MAEPNMREALAACRLSSELDEREQDIFADVLTLRDLQNGAVLVREGSRDSNLYVIVSGALSVVKHAGKPEEVTFNTLMPGDFAGELSFLDNAERYASLIAREDVRVLGLARERLEGLISSHPVIVYKVMRAIVRVVHEIQRRLAMQQAELTNYIYKQHGRY